MIKSSTAARAVSRLPRVPVAFLLLVAFGASGSQLDSAADIDNYFGQVVQTTKIPGIVAIVVDRNTVIYSGSFGYQNVGANIPMSLDTIFNIASMTKPLASAAIMTLVEEGKLDLDDPISTHLPEFSDMAVISSLESDGTFTGRQPTREVTIRDLMAHSSGLAYGFSNRIVHRLNGGRAFVDNADIGLLYDPGSSWSYGTGIGYVTRVVETISGQTFDDYLRERILQPLNMVETDYVVAPENIARVATVHKMTEVGLAESAVPEDVRSNVSGNGGLYSTARDYAKFIQLFLNDGVTHDGVPLLKAESVRLMGENQLQKVRVSLQDEPMPLISRAFPLGAGRDGFGLGFQITGPHEETEARSPGSLSWAGLYNTHFWIDRKNGIGAVLLMQYLPFYDEDAIATLSGFERRIYEAM